MDTPVWPLIAVRRGFRFRIPLAIRKRAFGYNLLCPVSSRRSQVDPEAAQLVLVAITAVAVITWLMGLRFLVVTYRAGEAGQGDDNPVSDLPAPSSGNRLNGTAEVDGQPAVLATKTASALAKSSPFGPVKITEKNDNHITFEHLGTGRVNQLAGRWLRRGEFRFLPVGQGRSRVEWTAELSKMDWLLRWGALFQVLGLIALVVGGWAISTYVVSSPDLAVRWQTVQMVQTVHFLWPPFLFGTLYRRGMKEVAAQFEALACNLPYYGA